MTLPANTLPNLASWLLARLNAIRHHEAGSEAVDEICTAVRKAEQVIDRPPDLLYAGICGAPILDEDGEIECDEDLYARVGSHAVICKACGANWNVQDRRTWMLSRLNDFLANSQQMARLITYLGITIPDSTIRWWASKGRIAQRGHDERGRPLYRLGEVVDIYIETKKAS